MSRKQTTRSEYYKRQNKQTIKNNFPMEQWEKFGISDKR